MNTNNKVLILIGIFILTITNVTAYININWDTPNQDNEYIPQYPQKIRTYIQSNETITTCTYNLDGKIYTTNSLNLKNIDLIKELRLAEGTYLLNLSCTSGTETSYSERTFLVSDAILFREDSERKFKLNLIELALIILIIFYIWMDDISIRLLSSGLMLIISVYATTIVKYEIIMWIPILISTLFILNGLFNLYERKRWKRRR